MSDITVLLVDDHTVVREGLRALLAAEGDIEVVGEAASGRDAVKLALRLKPAVVVMDIAMSRLNGMEAARQILKACPAIRIIMLSAHSDDKYVEQSLAHGAAGYLVKQTSARILATAIREVSKGNTFFSPSLTACLHRQADQSSARCRSCQHVESCMTPREVEVLQLVAEGRSNKQIAAELEISIKTVEKHRGNLTRKLNIYETASLTRYAISTGIIENHVRLTTV